MADGMNIEQRVLDFVHKHSLTKDRTKVLLAVSGGPDSVCLLHVMHGLRRELGIRLYVAHLNHGLRAEESDADAEYVAGLCKRLDIPSIIESRDVNMYRAQNHTSLEEASREVRYTFLAKTTATVGAECVAVGHTADDHVETVVMHLLRGSGTGGLRGLQPINQWQSSGKKLIIIRPLLEINRDETTAYCRRHHLRPHQDSSNLSPAHFRNRIRNQLLPQLKKYNPRIKEALLRTARIATDDIAFLDDEVMRLIEELTSKQENSVAIDKEGFVALPSSLKRHLLRHSIEYLLGNLKDIEAGHIEDIIKALDKPPGKVIGLPSGLNFTIEYDRYILGPNSATLSPFPVLGAPVHLNIPGNTIIPGWDIQADIISMSDFQITDEVDANFTACFDYDKTGNQLVVRSRQPGDRFQPLGMGRYKKLNKYMIDSRIPRSWRRRIPLVVSPEYIIWIVGWRIDERVKVSAGTGQVLKIRFKCS